MARRLNQHNFFILKECFKSKYFIEINLIWQEFLSVCQYTKIKTF